MMFKVSDMDQKTIENLSLEMNRYNEHKSMKISVYLIYRFRHVPSFAEWQRSVKDDVDLRRAGCLTLHAGLRRRQWTYLKDNFEALTVADVRLPCEERKDTLTKIHRLPAYCIAPGIARGIVEYCRTGLAKSLDIPTEHLQLTTTNVAQLVDITMHMDYVLHIFVFSSD